MCKTYDAIYELSKHTDSDVLICFLEKVKIEGELHRCCAEMGKETCYDSIITLKNAVVTCPKADYQKEFKWINIPSMHIRAFAFKCCEM